MPVTIGSVDDTAATCNFWCRGRWFSVSVCPTVRSPPSTRTAMGSKHSRTALSKLPQAPARNARGLSVQLLPGTMHVDHTSTEKEYFDREAPRRQDMAHQVFTHALGTTNDSGEMVTSVHRLRRFTSYPLPLLPPLFLPCRPASSAAVTPLPTSKNCKAECTPAKQRSPLRIHWPRCGGRR